MSDFIKIVRQRKMYISPLYYIYLILTYTVSLRNKVRQI